MRVVSSLRRVGGVRIATSRGSSDGPSHGRCHPSDGLFSPWEVWGDASNYIAEITLSLLYCVLHTYVLDKGHQVTRQIIH